MLDFDEDFYLEKNPDVAESVRRGEWPSGFAHYCVIGKSTGRQAVRPVDELWYTNTYPQVSIDISRGTAKSPTDHYRRIGRFRGYVASRRDPKPRDPAAPRSMYGGLWTDVGNALDVIAGRLDLGQIKEEQAAQLASWVNDGYVVLAGAISEDILDRAEAWVDRVYAGELPDIRFEVTGVSQNTRWIPEARTNAAKALDIHWFSPEIRELIFAENVLSFLHLIFERRVLASQSLTFWRGSAQAAHQDSAYVNYSLPMQFAASWIALQDIEPEAGELLYYRGSHKLPEYLYAGKFKGAEEAKRVNPAADLTLDFPRHIDLIRKQATGAGLVVDRFLAKRGDVLIWSSDLAHGGGPISKTRTRKSVVTHYCPAELAPQYFDAIAKPKIKSFAEKAFYSSALY